MLPSAELAAAREKCQLRSPGIGEVPRDVIEIGPPGDALIGDGVQPRQCRAHVKRCPGLSRAPRNQSSVVMRALPAGCTSKTSTVPPAESSNGPVAITTVPSVERTSPGAPVPGNGGSCTLGLNSFTSTPSSSAQAPGLGSSPRIM